MLTDFRTCVTSFQQILFGASDDDEDDLRAQLLFLLLLLLHIFKNTEYQKMEVQRNPHEPNAPKTKPVAFTTLSDCNTSSIHPTDQNPNDIRSLK